MLLQQHQHQQQEEVITIAFFPSEPLALRSVGEDCLGDSMHHQMQLTKETLCVGMPLMWQTPRACSAVFICILATVHQQLPTGTNHFVSKSRKGCANMTPTRRICIRSSREIPSVVGDCTTGAKYGFRYGMVQHESEGYLVCAGG